MNRLVIVADLGLASPNVATCNGVVVGSVSGRQPQQVPSSLHCVLRLRGGASSSSSSDGEFDCDRPVDNPYLDFYEAAGSGLGDDQRMLNDRRGVVTHSLSAGVPAREEGWRSSIFDHVREQEALFRSITQGRDQVPVPQPPVVQGPREDVQVRLTPHISGGTGDQKFVSRIFGPSPETPGKVLRHMVVQTDPPPEPVLRKPHNIKQKRRNRLVRERYDPLGSFPCVGGHSPWMSSWWWDVRVDAHGADTRDVACGPSLDVSWVDPNIVVEEPIVRSPVVSSVSSSAVLPVVDVPVARPVVLCWLGSDVPVAGGAHGFVSRRSTPVVTNHPVVDFALGCDPVACGQRGLPGQLDGVLVRSYGFPDESRSLLSPHTPLYISMWGEYMTIT